MKIFFKAKFFKINLDENILVLLLILQNKENQQKKMFVVNFYFSENLNEFENTLDDVKESFFKVNKFFNKIN